MTRRRIVAIAAIAVALPAFYGPLLHAQPEGRPMPAIHFRARENRPGGEEEGQVVTGQTVVMRIRSWHNELSPYERAIIAAKRLNDFVEDYGVDGPLRVAEDGGVTRVIAGALPVVTVDPVTAERNGSTVAALASDWLGNIRRALGNPPPQLVPDDILDPALADDGGTALGQVALGAQGRRVPMVALAAEGAVGVAEVAGPRAADCAAVVAIDGTHAGCARITAFVPVSRVPQEAAELRRLGNVRVIAWSPTNAEAATEAAQ